MSIANKHLEFSLNALLGPAYARHMFRTRSEQPVNAEAVWKSSHTKGFVRFIEEHWPPKALIKIGVAIRRQSDVFKFPNLGIEHHYDLSNDFYKLFLDKKYMFYSYGDFLSDADTLEDAQENKATYIAKLIDPKPGEKILDLGCGWGSMLNKIYSVTGDRENLTGYTLSKEQIKYMRDELGFNAHHQDLMTVEYEENSFDKIYSIGTVEHIRNQDLLRFSQTLARALKSGGRIVHQFFYQHGELPSPVLTTARDIFPGSELSSFRCHRQTFEQAGLRITHHSIHDYRPTLRAWFDRLAENQSKACELVGVENYNRYISYLALAHRLFDDGLLIPSRFVLEPK